MNHSKDKIHEILKRVIHPSTENDIISMGLVADLIVTDDKVSFSLSFPAFNDPLKSSIKKACEQILAEELPGTPVEIQIVTPVKPIIKAKPEKPLSNVKHVVAIASGKGGVGKSTVAANLAVAFATSGAKVGLIDADIYGPSIPKMFQVEAEKPYIKQKDGKDKIVPIEKYGVKMLSIGFFVDPGDATIWRGPMASNALKQIMTDGDWEGVDYLFIDLPPGTSDIHITISQDIKLSGAVIVSTPQDIALSDALKGISMFQNKGINVPVIGLIENMSWFTPEELPENKYYIFGKDGGKNLASKTGIPFLGQIPIIQSIREDADRGTPAVLQKNRAAEYYKDIAQAIHVNLLKLFAEQN